MKQIPQFLHLIPFATLSSGSKEQNFKMILILRKRIDIGELFLLVEWNLLKQDEPSPLNINNTSLQGNSSFMRKVCRC